MADQFQTSFIPKKGKEKKKRKGSSMGVLTLIGIFIFVVALAGAVGVFFFERVVEGGIEKKKADLERARDAFEPALIETLARLDTRIETAKDIVARHIAPSKMFELLEQSTLENVRFLNFNYAFDAEGVLLSMRGEAKSFSAVALQSDEFAENDFILEPVFSDLDVNTKGNVTFSFAGKVDPSYVEYYVNGAVPAEVPVPETPRIDEGAPLGPLDGDGSSENNL